jgi:hypothetical protein
LERRRERGGTREKRGRGAKGALLHPHNVTCRLDFGLKIPTNLRQSFKLPPSVSPPLPLSKFLKRNCNFHFSLRLILTLYLETEKKKKKNASSLKDRPYAADRIEFDHTKGKRNSVVCLGAISD